MHANPFRDGWHLKSSNATCMWCIAVLSGSSNPRGRQGTRGATRALPALSPDGRRARAIFHGMLPVTFERCSPADTSAYAAPRVGTRCCRSLAPLSLPSQPTITHLRSTGCPSVHNNQPCRSSQTRSPVSFPPSRSAMCARPHSSCHAAFVAGGSALSRSTFSRACTWATCRGSRTCWM